MKKRILFMILILLPAIMLLPGREAQAVGPNVTITISDGTATAAPGTEQLYTIVVTNAGPDMETNIPVYCMLPDKTQNDFTGPCGNWTATTSGGGTVGEVAGKVLTNTPVSDSYMTSVSLPAGASVIFNLCVGIQSAATGSFSVRASLDDGSLQATDTDILTPEADLSVTINDSTTSLFPGETAPYTITVTNNGPSDVIGATLNCALPTGATDAIWGPNGYYSGAYANPSNGTGALTSTINLLKGASYTFWFSVQTDSAASGSLSTTAVVTSPVIDSNASNNSATDTDTFGNSSSADLSLSMGFDDQTGNLTGEVTFYTAISLNTSGNATNVVVSIPLPAGVTLVNAAPEQGTYDSASGHWTVGTLTNYADKKIVFKATVDYTALRVATASLSSLDQIEGSLENNSASLRVSDRADIAVTASVSSAKPQVGGNVTFTVSLTNNGPDTASNIWVDAMLPAGLTYVSDVTSSGYYNSDSTYTDYGYWYPDPLDSGDTAVLTLRASVSSSAANSFNLQTEAVQPDPAMANNIFTITVTPVSTGGGSSGTVPALGGISSGVTGSGTTLSSTVFAGSFALGERGFVYGTGLNPTVGAVGVKKIAAGNGAGSFEATLSGLNANTVYYARAYVMSGGSVYYGETISFTTSALVNVPNTGSKANALGFVVIGGAVLFSYAVAINRKRVKQ
ncbi:MAG TPA: DUF11 domain-containing protein [Clostridia bacterium]|nr:DUF11 domain-containing protein [Clostridia bacterium]